VRSCLFGIIDLGDGAPTSAIFSGGKRGLVLYQGQRGPASRATGPEPTGPRLGRLRSASTFCGAALAAEGKLFLQEVIELLKRVDESVEKTRALARGEYGELHIGYAPVPTAEILPLALEAFRKAVPRVKLVLHDLASDELIIARHDATLELAVMVQPTGEQTAGIEFETLRSHTWSVALTAAHPFARFKSLTLKKASRRTTRRSPPQGLLRISHATKGDVTPAGEKFCKILRQISCGASKPKPR
jgi:LysR substrate binding domain